MTIRKFRKKGALWLLSLCCVIAVPVYCLGLQNGETFEIKKGELVPLFMIKDVNLKYDVGAHGNNCYDLDTVLPAGTFVKIEDVSDDRATVRVSCKVSESCCFKGFIHKHFIEHCADPIAEASFEIQCPERDIMSLREICEILDSCIEKEMPYSYGCNNFAEIQLDDLYSFSGPSESPPHYHCVGFDCSGLLHYISSWTLPHSTRQLYNFSDGDCILSLDVDASDAELQSALNLMQDTDFVVFIHDYQYTGGSGHVIVSLHGGFVEAVGQNIGVIFTDKEAALERLRKLLDSARRNGAKDVRVIRWHPELKAGVQK